LSASGGFDIHDSIFAFPSNLALLQSEAGLISESEFTGLPLQLGLLVAGMSVKGAGWRKLTQFVAYHVLGDKHRYKFATVVNG
jgi:hypothetical protein